MKLKSLATMLLAAGLATATVTAQTTTNAEPAQKAKTTKCCGEKGKKECGDKKANCGDKKADKKGCCSEKKEADKNCSSKKEGDKKGCCSSKKS